MKSPIKLFKDFKFYLRRKKLRRIRKKQQKEYENNLKLKNTIQNTHHNNSSSSTINNNNNIVYNQYSINNTNSNNQFTNINNQVNTTPNKNPPPPLPHVNQQTQTQQSQHQQHKIKNKKGSIGKLFKRGSTKDEINILNTLPFAPTPLTTIQELPEENNNSNNNSSQLNNSLSSSIDSSIIKQSGGINKVYDSPPFEDQLSEYKRIQRERFSTNKQQHHQHKHQHHKHHHNQIASSCPSPISLSKPQSLSSSYNNNNQYLSTNSLSSSYCGNNNPLNSSTNILKKSGKLRMNTSQYQDIYLSSRDGGLWINDLPLKLKGINWFGCETETSVVHGLWARDYNEYLDFLQSNHFNAIRIPFSLEMVLKDPFPTSISITSTMNSDLQGLRALSVLDLIIEAAGERGIFILLDLHSFRPNDRLQDGLWYNSVFSEQETLKCWNILILRYGRCWNVLGVDLKNEPYSATWNTGNMATDWDQAINRIGGFIQNNGGNRWLIFGQGVASQQNSQLACCWAESFEGEGRDSTSINLPLNDKFVYSPHCYGPSVVNHVHFRSNNFPSNLPPHWDLNFGLLPTNTKRAVVVGEWGGKYFDSLDKLWMDSFVNYLVQRGTTDNFFWCLNPNSGDTNGVLMDDWYTIHQEKLDLLQKLVPHPTKIKFDKDLMIYTISSTLPTQYEA
eukprot:gene3731-4648_t